MYTFAPRPLDGKKVRHYIDPVEIAKLEPGKMVHECTDHTDTVMTVSTPSFCSQFKVQKFNLLHFSSDCYKLCNP